LIEYDLPIRLKISYFYFFLQGAIGIILGVLVWFFPIEDFTIKIYTFIAFVLFTILNIEVAKALRQLKKWAYFTAIIICLLEPLAAMLNIVDLSAITIFGSLIIIFLITLRKSFWCSKIANNNHEFNSIS